MVDPGTMSDTQARGTLATDHSLLRRVRTGEDDAATDLYHRYAKRLWSLANNQLGQKLSRRLEADDVVQSVFRTFFRRVVEGQYDVPAGKEIWGLFLVIALNKVRAAAVRNSAQKRDTARTEALSATHEQVAAPRDDHAAILRDVIAEIVSTLSETQQQIITMRIEGFSADEIAKAAERSKRTVERVLQQFRARLTAEIEEG